MLLSSHRNRNDPVSLLEWQLLPRVCVLILSAVSTPNLHNKEPAIEWHAPEFQEFVPETFGGPMVCIVRFFMGLAGSLSHSLSSSH